MRITVRKWRSVGFALVLGAVAPSTGLGLSVAHGQSTPRMAVNAVPVSAQANVHHPGRKAKATTKAKTAKTAREFSEAIGGRPGPAPHRIFQKEHP